MADTTLAVLLRNCAHDSTATNHGTHIRYALMADSFSIQIAKTPIQVPIPQQAPEIIDIGFYRPSISVGGIVDTNGRNPTATALAGDNANTGLEQFSHLEKISVSRQPYGSTTAEVQDYYIPTKNLLEEAVYKWITTEDANLELEIGDANFPVYKRKVDGLAASGSIWTTSPYGTCGGVYLVAMQQARFQVDPAMEDRWTFQMQFVCESRKDVKFTS